MSPQATGRVRLADIAPRLAAARDAHEKEAWRGISRCRHGGYHAYGAGPCFDRPEWAMARRDWEDAEWERTKRRREARYR